MYNIMVLGAGVYQVPLIKKVRQMGYRAVVVSPEGNYPGFDYADETVFLDTRDHLNILKKAKELSIKAVVTSGSDVSVPTIGYLVDELGLYGTGYEAAKRSMDKVLMKQCFIENGVATAPFYSVTNYDELLVQAEEIGYPVMVKATDSSGSRGITKVNCHEDLADAYHESLSVTKSNFVIVEKYLDGYELGASALIQRGIAEVYVFNDINTPPPVSVPIAHSIPSGLDSQLLDEIKGLVSKAALALGVHNGFINADIMIVKGQPYMLELGARMGATCIPEITSIYSGLDMYECIINLALGEKVILAEFEKQPCAGEIIRSSKTGVVKNIFIPDSVKSCPDLIDLSLDVNVGDAVRAFKVGPDRIGQIIVKGRTSDEAQALATDLLSAIKIDVE
ncbi:ATP-grasp domain-containing protein [Halomonas sp. LY9]